MPLVWRVAHRGGGYERNHNGLIFVRYRRNRNPFVDYYELINNFGCYFLNRLLTSC